MITDEARIRKELLATGEWGDDAIALGIRANFHCEYCGKDLLKNLENYKEWNIDHIVPKSHGGTEQESNLALSCRTCNVSVKGHWNPADTIKTKVTREELLRVTREYIENRRVAMNKQLRLFRKIVSLRSRDAEQ
jgi:5-methylcytosine-specific restriction endonuclease McrA